MVQVIPKRTETLSEFVESNFVLPAVGTAHPGPLHLYSYQRGMFDALVDPNIEFVSLLKSAQIGYTLGLAGAIAHYMVRDPAPMICIMPGENDARGLVVEQLEP